MGNRMPSNAKTGQMLAVSSLTLVLSACGHHEAAPVGEAPVEAVPAAITLQGASLTVGTNLTRPAHPATVASYSITKTPITVGQYRQCVQAQACSKPALRSIGCSIGKGAAGPTYAEAGRDDVPVTCVTPKQAEGYCSWVKGRLPTPEEWSYAARGPSATRYAWGNEEPTCERHWATCCADQCEVHEAASVGQHEQGNSQFGMADVLAVGGELVRGAKNCGLAVCASNHCVVKGLVPGAIDFFVPLSKDDSGRSSDASVFGFRCVTDGAGQ